MHTCGTCPCTRVGVCMWYVRTCVCVCACISWVWPDYHVWLGSRVTSLYHDLFCCNKECSPIGLQRSMDFITTHLTVDVR